MIFEKLHVVRPFGLSFRGLGEGQMTSLRVVFDLFPKGQKLHVVKPFGRPPDPKGEILLFWWISSFLGTLEGPEGFTTCSF